MSHIRSCRRLLPKALQFVNFTLHRMSFLLLSKECEFWVRPLVSKKDNQTLRSDYKESFMEGVENGLSSQPHFGR